MCPVGRTVRAETLAGVAACPPFSRRRLPDLQVQSRRPEARPGIREYARLLEVGEEITDGGQRYVVCGCRSVRSAAAGSGTPGSRPLRERSRWFRVPRMPEVNSCPECGAEVPGSGKTLGPTVAGYVGAPEGTEVELRKREFADCARCGTALRRDYDGDNPGPWFVKHGAA